MTRDGEVRSNRSGTPDRGPRAQVDLVVDLGNSSLKWSPLGRDIWLPRAVLLRGRNLDEILDEAWASITEPARVVVSNVAGDRAGEILLRWVERTWAAPVRWVRAQPEAFGIRNGYRAPGQLGADRWAALIAARALTQSNVCVVDCGTAVTVDILADSGEHLGGVIFPGLALLRSSLYGGTAAITQEAGNDASCLARSTADGVAAGTAYGLVGAIDRFIREADDILGENRIQVLVTGGDAEIVTSRLGCACMHVPDLVLRGLARIAGTL